MDSVNASWLELNTTAPETAIQFYQETLGWDFESTELPMGGSYWIASLNDKPVGGVFCLNEDEAAEILPHWMTYMKVDNISDAQQSACQAGGEVVRPALQLEGVGKLAIIADYAGALIGLIEPQPDS